MKKKRKEEKENSQASSGLRLFPENKNPQLQSECHRDSASSILSETPAEKTFCSRTRLILLNDAQRKMTAH